MKEEVNPVVAGKRKCKSLTSSLGLVDLPMERRKYTWYKENGSSCSRLDRFLLSSSWIAKWPHLVQVGLKRKVSDHAAVLLKEDVTDWGPKPFKFVNGWMNEKGFKELVEEEWRKHKVEGWSGFVLKEKLKHIKEIIKRWYKEKFGNLDRRIDEKTDQVNDLDSKLEEGELDDLAAVERKKAWEDLNKMIELKDHLRCQQAKNKWIKEGDTNSKFFHKCVERKGRIRKLKGLRIKGKWLEGVNEVKDGVCQHFQSLFAAGQKHNSELPDIFSSRQISQNSVLELERNFSEEEVKYAIWDCGSEKSRGPDGFNFYFFKCFWDVSEEVLIRRSLLSSLSVQIQLRLRNSIQYISLEGFTRC